MNVSVAVLVVQPGFGGGRAGELYGRDDPDWGEGYEAWGGGVLGGEGGGADARCESKDGKHVEGEHCEYRALVGNSAVC